MITRIASSSLLACALALSSCDRAQDIAPPPASPADEVIADGGTAVALPQEQLAAEYANLSGLVAEARTDAIWKRFDARQQATLAVGNNQLTVTAVGDDPVIFLPPFAAGHRFMIQAVINSSIETVAQMYFLVRGQNQYREAQSQIAPLHPGRDVVYFRIDAPNVIDPIRFDPSREPGEFTIESMVAMGLP